MPYTDRHSPILIPDGNTVYLVINRSAALRARHSYDVSYHGSTTIITVAKPERALALLPSVFIDKIVFADAVRKDEHLDRFVSLATAIQPHLQIVNTQSGEVYHQPVITTSAT